MKIKSSVMVCISVSKLAAVVLSLIWLFVVSRYLQIKPEYATREYLKTTQNTTKTNSIIRMNTVTKFKSITQPKSQIKQKYEVENFQYFNLLQLVQNKNRIQCQNQFHALIINTNYKTVSDSYLSLYKEIQKQNTLCKNYIYQLNRKDHLLMDSELLISQYVMQIAITIQKFVVESGQQNLIILTFQQGCALVLKAFQYISQQMLAKLDNVIFINAYNPNILLLNQSPKKYINTIKQRLQATPKKLQILNQTRLIFINTINYWDPNFYKEQHQQNFNLLWENDKKLQNTLFLNTRFMKNIYMLYHQKDYFTSTTFVNRLAKYMLNVQSLKKLPMIQYFFNYGEVYTKSEEELKDIKAKVCKQGRLHHLNKVTRILSTACLQIQIAKKMKEKENQTMLIITSKKAYIINNLNQRIEPIFQIFQHNYFIFDRVKKTKQIWIVNQDRNQILIQFHIPSAPISNPLPNSSLLAYSPMNYFSKSYKQLTQQRKLIKICPNGNYLIYPQNFYNNLTGNAIATVFTFYSLNKLLYDYNNISSVEDYDCYPDLFTQFMFVPKEIEFNWWRERNIILFILICAYTKKQSIFTDIFLYLTITYIIHYLHIPNQSQSILIILTLLITTICITIQKCIDIIVHLVKFIQDMLDIRIRQLMLLLIVFATTAKQLKQNIINVQQLSAWKLLCISLIFVVNKDNMLILLIKMYYLYDHIIYNHNDCTQLFLILFWIYISLQCNLVTSRQQKNQTFMKFSSQYCGCSFKLSNRTFLQILLVVVSGLLIQGSSQVYVFVINGYIMLKSLQYMLNRIKRDKVYV